MKRDSGLPEDEIRCVENAVIQEEERIWRKDPEVRRKWAMKRWQGCVGHSRKNNYCLGINKADVVTMVSGGCHYCGYDGPIGIDRIDSCEGYTRPNTVGCCTECNIIMGDVPPEVKDILKPALAKCREIDFGGWRAPVKRHKGKAGMPKTLGLDLTGYADALTRVQAEVLALRASKGRPNVRYDEGWSVSEATSEPEVTYTRKRRTTRTEGTGD